MTLFRCGPNAPQWESCQTFNQESSLQFILVSINTLISHRDRAVSSLDTCTGIGRSNSTRKTNRNITQSVTHSGWRLCYYGNTVTPESLCECARTPEQKPSRVQRAMTAAMFRHQAQLLVLKFTTYNYFCVQTLCKYSSIKYWCFNLMAGPSEHQNLPIWEWAESLQNHRLHL